MGPQESADWWSAGQRARQAIYGAATEMMLDMADIQTGSQVLDVAEVRVNQRLWQLAVLVLWDMCLVWMFPQTC